MYDILILGGTVVTATSIGEMDIAIQGEQIAAVDQAGVLGSDAKKVIDATGRLVMPGGIDPHVHYSTPSWPSPKGLISPEPQEYSPAAAFGGVTTIIDFVFQEPPQSLHDAIEDKKKQAAGRMAVDYGLHAGVTRDFSFEVIDEIGDVIRNGIPTIKTLMCYPAFMCDDGRRFGVMTEVAKHGGLSLVHAEDQGLISWLTEKYVREGKTHGAYIIETRGPLVEEAAIRRAMFLAEKSGSPLYVLHVAAKAGVEALGEARARGLPFYGEATTPHLSFTAEKLWAPDNQGLLWNTTPTIKYQEDRDALWQGLADDRLQVGCSDHWCLSYEDRYEKMGTTIDALQAGSEGVELRIPVLFHLGVQEGRLSLNRFVEVASTNAAKVMGLYPKKGSLSVGADADIMIFDPEKTWTVDWKDLHVSATYSSWDGWELRGKVVTTILRGSILVENETYQGSKTGGRFIPRRLGPEIVGQPCDLSTTFESRSAGVPERAKGGEAVSTRL